MKKICLFLLVIAVLLPVEGVDGQYFGRNKPVYETFDFQVEESEHFAFYHYLKNPEKLRQLALWTETWYGMHEKVLRDTFYEKNPILFYSNHAEFQQTNAISGNISVGTGGVTEGFKNRVILPIALTNQQTFHVIGHELVHAFQYNMVLNGPNTSMRNLANLPLWMVEGLAEYLSIGRHDPHTAMWMRNAILNDDVPELRKMDNGQYFPYRYGQAFWAFLTGVYGDKVIEPFFMGTAIAGLEVACDSLLGISLDSLSSLWDRSLREHYAPFLRVGGEDLPGGALFTEKNSGRMNISPVLSPDSRYVIFLSEKDLFSIDLYLADARTGKVIRKITSSTRDGHLDDLNYIESAGTWSDDGEQFAFVAVKKGRNVLVIKDVKNARTVEEIALPGLAAFSHPAWHPRGRSVVVSGLKEGQTDLYEYVFRSGELRQLTDDAYAEIHPCWSKDGQRLLFATDELSYERGRNAGKWTYNIAEMRMDSGEQVRVFDWFYGADNLNPQYDRDGRIYFLSDRDGRRNLYSYDPVSDSLFQETDLMTGISGITSYAPAISVTQRSDRILYTHYFGEGYSIYYARSRELLRKPVSADAVDQRAGTLPKPEPRAADLVNAQLEQLDYLEGGQQLSLEEKELKTKFRLDYLGGGGGAGVATGTVGTGVGLVGGVDALFSDILGNHQFYTGLSLNGEIIDIGGVLQYINRKRRVAWGGLFSHIPYRSGRYLGLFADQVEFSDGTRVDAYREDVELVRIFEERAGLFAQYPFSVTQRVELGGSFNFYSQRNDVYSTYYRRFGNFVDYNQVLATNRQKLESPDGFDFYNMYAAWVGDNSFFGLTSPLKGYRFRVAAEKFYSGYSFSSLTLDYRRYFRLRPVTLAVRGTHIGRYPGYFRLFENSGELESVPMYLAQPWFIRGYSELNTTELSSRYGIQIDQLGGSKLLFGGAEIRFPFTGPERLALINSRFLFTDLNIFFDTGIAFREYGQLTDAGRDWPYPEPVLISSAGVSLRVNLFNALILEPYYAWPLRENSKGVFGFNFWPGW